MGKGDVKSRKGKLWRGSYGNSRKRDSNKGNNVAVVEKKAANKA